MQYLLVYDLVKESKDWSRPLEPSTLDRDESERIFEAVDDSDAVAKTQQFLKEGSKGPDDLSKPRHERRFKKLLAIREVIFSQAP